LRQVDNERAVVAILDEFRTGRDAGIRLVESLGAGAGSRSDEARPVPRSADLPVVVVFVGQADGS
jgi:hypothetical protein